MKVDPDLERPSSVVPMHAPFTFDELRLMIVKLVILTAFGLDSEISDGEGVGVAD